MEKAALVGDKIRQEDGVHSAIHAIITYLPRAGRDRSSLGWFESSRGYVDIILCKAVINDR